MECAEVVEVLLLMDLWLFVDISSVVFKSLFIWFVIFYYELLLDGFIELCL